MQVLTTWTWLAVVAVEVTDLFLNKFPILFSLLFMTNSLMVFPF